LPWFVLNVLRCTPCFFISFLPSVVVLFLHQPSRLNVVVQSSNLLTSNRTGQATSCLALSSILRFRLPKNVSAFECLEPCDRLCPPRVRGIYAVLPRSVPPALLRRTFFLDVTPGSPTFLGVLFSTVSSFPCTGPPTAGRLPPLQVIRYCQSSFRIFPCPFFEKFTFLPPLPPLCSGGLDYGHPFCEPALPLKISPASGAPWS